MPINPNIPEAFIAAYAHFYQPKVVEPSFVTTTTTFIKTTSFTLLGKMTPDDKSKSCDDIISLFKTNLSVEEWMELTFTLGEKAQVHQIDKNLASKYPKPSHLSQALHASRSYIVACLAKECHDIYQCHLRALTAQVAEKDQLILKNRRSTTIDVASLVKDRDMLLLKLAYLGDESALNRCIDRQLFNYMPSLNHDPANAPFCMHKDYFELFYNDKLKSKLSEDLHCFFKKAALRTLPFQLTAHDSQIQPKLNLSEAAAPEQSVSTVQTNTDQLFTNSSPPAGLNSPASLFKQPKQDEAGSGFNLSLSTVPI